MALARRVEEPSTASQADILSVWLCASAPSSIGLDAGFHDDRRPAGEFRLLLCCQSFGSLIVHRPDFLADFFEALMHRWIGQGDTNGRIELGDDIGRRALGRP